MDGCKKEFLNSSDITKKCENGKKYQRETFFMCKATCRSMLEHISSTLTGLSTLCWVESGDKVKGHAAEPSASPIPGTSSCCQAKLGAGTGYTYWQFISRLSIHPGSVAQTPLIFAITSKQRSVFILFKVW